MGGLLVNFFNTKVLVGDSVSTLTSPRNPVGMTDVTPLKTPRNNTPLFTSFQPSRAGRGTCLFDRSGYVPLNRIWLSRFSRVHSRSKTDNPGNEVEP